MLDLVSALKIVDLPTLGKPIIPTFKDMVKITNLFSEVRKSIINL